MEQCLKCDKYFDNISKRQSYYDKTFTIIHDDQTFSDKKKGYCYDCLKEYDLLHKCSHCDQIKESLSFMDKKKMIIRDDNYFLGWIHFNVLSFDGPNDYICEKRIKFCTYCLACAEQLEHIKFEFDYDININDIDSFKQLGYSFKRDEELLQTGKSLERTGSSQNRYRVRIEKCKRRKWKKIPKGREKDKQQKLRELFY